MALLDQLRDRHAQRKERAQIRQRLRDLDNQESRKARAATSEAGMIVSIERNVERLQHLNSSQNVPPDEVWEYFNIDFPDHGTRFLGWRVNGFSISALEHEEILRVSGLLDHAYEGEKIIGYFDTDGELVALEKRTTSQ